MNDLFPFEISLNLCLFGFKSFVLIHLLIVINNVLNSFSEVMLLVTEWLFVDVEILDESFF